MDIQELMLIGNGEQLERGMLMECNRASAEYGLALSSPQMHLLMQSRRDALAETERVEFGRGIVPELVRAFAGSPYLQQTTYAETLLELQEIFYHLRDDAGAAGTHGGVAGGTDTTSGFAGGEQAEAVSDDELLTGMRIAFDELLGGDTVALSALSVADILNAMHTRQDDADAPSVGEGVYAEILGLSEPLLIDDDGGTYSLAASEWYDDETADGWDGERWTDDFE